jgi:hypothetical protein
MHWPNHSLLDSQWNDVFAAIQAAGLNPAEFERTETSSPRANGYVPVLTTHLLRRPSRSTSTTLSIGRITHPATTGHATSEPPGIGTANSIT